MAYLRPVDRKPHPGDPVRAPSWAEQPTRRGSPIVYTFAVRDQNRAVSTIAATSPTHPAIALRYRPTPTCAITSGAGRTRRSRGCTLSKGKGGDGDREDDCQASVRSDWLRTKRHPPVGCRHQNYETQDLPSPYLCQRRSIDTMPALAVPTPTGTLSPRERALPDCRPRRGHAEPLTAE